MTSSLILVGDGFSAATFLVQFLPLAKSVSSLNIVGSRTHFGKGLAYSTPDATHLLNVPAARLSLFPDQPHDFVDWLKEEDQCTDAFVTRRQYGRYLHMRSLEVLAKASIPVQFHSAQGTAIHAQDKGWSLTLSTGVSLSADQMVLALGYEFPQIPAEWVHLASDPRFIQNPWRPLPAVKHALILGSGLTMVDLCLSWLNSSPELRLSVLSRRGLSPLPHYSGPLAPQNVPAVDLRHHSPHAALNALRKCVRENPAMPWQWIVDSIRPQTASLWQSWDLNQKRSFLRHLRPYWDVHRHRVAPKAFQLWQEKISAGSVQLRRGRASQTASSPSGLKAIFPRDAIEAEVVLNCTGANPLSVHALWNDLPEDPLRLGTPTDDLGRPLHQDGLPAANLYYLGPGLRTRFWECTAVPELRAQAAKIIPVILSEK